MSKFVRSNFTLKTFTDNSYKAIDEGAYDSEEYDFSGHESISIKKTILSCPHAPLIIEIKSSSPSRGRIIKSDEINVIEQASVIARSGASGLSVLTQPYLFNGSIKNLAMIRQKVKVPLAHERHNCQ